MSAGSMVMASRDSESGSRWAVRGGVFWFYLSSYAQGAMESY